MYPRIDIVDQPLSSLTQSNLNFEPSVVGIRQKLIEIWSCKHEFQTRNFWPASKYWRYQVCQQTADKISTFGLHFQLKSKQKGRDNEF